VKRIIEAAGGRDRVLTLQAGDHDVSGRTSSRQRVHLYSGSRLIASIRADRRGRFRFSLTPEQLRQIGEGSSKSLWVKVRGRSSRVFSATVDTKQPTVAVTSSASVLKSGEAATVTFTFSEVPKGFSANSITVSGGILSDLGVGADPTIYSATFTPLEGTSGPASIAVAAGSYTDAAGNAGLPGASALLSVETSVPNSAQPAENVQRIKIEMVMINDKGNPADTNGYGRVDANYSIGKYEVTIEQYCAFLNAVARSDPYRLYNPGLMTSALNAGINRSGTDGSYSYLPVSGTERFPITGINWFDAARFANWLDNGQPLGPSGPSTTENGAYNLNGKTSGQSVSRNTVNPNTGATVSFALPTENEWYKAAYYSPMLNNGKGGYYTYATQSNTAPGNHIGSENNQVNYILDPTGVYSVSQKAYVIYTQNHLSAVGSFSGSQSAYGTFDQNGGVWEVLSNNILQNQLFVPLRGGGWTSLASLLQSGYRLGVGTDSEAVNAGFRIVQPPTSSNLNPESPSEPNSPPSEAELAKTNIGQSDLSNQLEHSDSSKPFNGATDTVMLELVTVGDANNNVDPLTGFGNVDHTFQIGTKSITIGQYATFLNAVAREDANNLFNPKMQSDLNVAGIQRTGLNGSYQYNVIDNTGSSANRPITYVSWFDAARFANWMANGQPSGIQSRSTTEDGAYSLDDDATRAPAKNPINPNTSKPPTYYIPSENEWYKAAYFNPDLNSNVGGYYLYATQSNVAPVNTPSIGGSNSANLANNFVFYNTQSNVYDPITNYLTDVGFFANSRSHYGTYDQSGLVYQWNDLDSNSSLERGLRGGYWFSAGQSSISSTFNMATPNRESSDAGFRLAAPDIQWLFG
jgi:formylglycine-generating enzyme required for sulfatase activity